MFDGMRLIMLRILPLLFLIITLSCIRTESDTPYLSGFDFDGDKQNDRIDYSFSGGAHCCYTISIFLTSSKTTYDFPFQFDGGYITGLDDSNPDTFYIDDFDRDGLPEIFLKTNTYNEDVLDMPQEWRDTYNIQSNLLLIDYYNHQFRVIDFSKANQ